MLRREIGVRVIESGLERHQISDGVQSKGGVQFGGS